VSHTDPVLLVRTLNVIFTAFDILAEDFGVYKVEAIAESYLLVSGCPQVCLVVVLHLGGGRSLHALCPFIFCILPF